MRISVENEGRVSVQGLPSRVIQHVRDELEFVNPEWVRKKRFARWMGKKTPYRLSFLRTAPNGDLIVPRGFAASLLEILEEEGLSVELDDKTRLLPDVPMNFKKELRPYQHKATRDILARRFGVLQAPPGSGKTVIALSVVAARQQPALVIVHTKELLYQWCDQIVSCLGIPSSDIGLIGDGHGTTGGAITVAIVNSLYRRVEDVKQGIGFLVVDECHKTPARTFTEAVSGFDCRYMLGLSATPYRSDGLTKLIHFYLGPQVHEIGHVSLQDKGQIMTATVLVRTTNFNFAYRDNYQEMINRLAANRERNEQIASDAATEAKKAHGIVLIVSDRKEHCDVLEKLVRNSGVSTCLLTGSIPAEERKKIVEGLRSGATQVVVATLQLIGEGFDLPALSSIVLATPIRFSGRLIQAIGRTLRPHTGKVEARIYDYLDRSNVLKSAFNARMQVYRDLQLRVLGPDVSGGKPAPPRSIGGGRYSKVKVTKDPADK